MPAHRPQRKRIVYAQHATRKLALRFLIVTCLILITGAIIQAFIVYSNRLWDFSKQNQFTIVLATKPVVIASYKNDTKELILVPMPENLEVNGAFEIGSWKVDSLYELGEQKGIGGRLLSLSLQNAFGIPIDGWIDARGLQWLGYSRINDVNNSSAGNASFIPASIFGAFNLGKSNLTFFDALNVITVMGTTPASRRMTLFPQKTGILNRQKLASGEMGWRIVDDENNNIVRREMIDQSIIAENVGVGVINSTNIPGFGKRVARLVEGVGAGVLWVKTEGQIKDRCILRANLKASQTKTFSRLYRLFGCSVNIDKDTKPSLNIELVVGESLAPEYPSQ